MLKMNVLMPSHDEPDRQGTSVQHQGRPALLHFWILHTQRFLCLIPTLCVIAAIELNGVTAGKLRKEDCLQTQLKHSPQPAAMQ